MVNTHREGSSGVGEIENAEITGNESKVTKETEEIGIWAMWACQLWSSHICIGQMDLLI